MRVVALLGLGMDARAVKQLSSLVNIEVHHQIPQEPQESLRAYALRWGHHLQLQAGDVVIGMSFAGPMALEMTDHFKLAGCVLLSTFVTPEELPKIHRRALRLGLHHWIPYRLGWWLGKRWARRKAILDPKNARAIAAIERKTDPSFYRWVIDALGKWEGTESSYPQLRIHGLGDRVLPLDTSTTGVEFLEGNHFLLADSSARRAMQLKIDAFLGNLAS
ncbi:hypothetical protein HZ996_10450 [Cryomorphaceae bacterium]|nr:hypothetical protein HZ996_10450 [Cryomorphaceae bacterium]